MEEAFRGCDVAILVGAMPRREGMERRDLLEKNAKIFQVHGRVLDTVAKKSVKVREASRGFADSQLRSLTRLSQVLVVGNPANTNALITSTFAPSISRDQFTCLTMLDQVRATCLPLLTSNRTELKSNSHCGLVSDLSRLKTSLFGEITQPLSILMSRFAELKCVVLISNRSMPMF